MTVYHDLFCPIHITPMVSVKQKPQLLGKCIWKACEYGVRADDASRQVDDVSELNHTIDGHEAETLS